jgi:putative transposase
MPSARMLNWNYGSEGMYFVTVCTKSMKHFFGKVENQKMILNELGLNAQSEWLKTISMRPDVNLELGEFIVMPNHFHGIV